MNVPTNKIRTALIATLLLGLGASALADGTAQAPAPQPAAPAITLQGQPAPAPTARPTPPAPGQAGPRGGHGPRGAGPGGVAPCAPGARLAMRPAPGGSDPAGRARPTPPTSNLSAAAQPAAPKAPKGDKMDKGTGPKDKGMGKDDQGGKGEICPPAPKGMEQGAPQSGAAAPGQATSNVAPAVRDLGRLDALSAQTSDSRIRGYLNDARTYLQSASKAQQKAGRDLLHAAEALVRGNQTPQR